MILIESVSYLTLGFMTIFPIMFLDLSPYIHGSNLICHLAFALLLAFKLFTQQWICMLAVIESLLLRKSIRYTVVMEYMNHVCRFYQKNLQYLCLCILTDVLIVLYVSNS